MDLAALRAEVVRNTWRDDLETDALDLHINEACRHVFNMREWWWREAIKISIASADDRLDLPSNFSSPTSIAVIVDSDDTREPLDITTISKLRRAYNSANTGRPCHYAISGGELFVGPRPDQSYAYELIYKIKNTTLSDPSDTNEAATHNGLAVAARAAATIAATILHDETMAARMGAAFNGFIATAEDEDDKRRVDMTTGDIRPDDHYHLAAFGSANFLGD